MELGDRLAAHELVGHRQAEDHRERDERERGDARCAAAQPPSVVDRVRAPHGATTPPRRRRGRGRHRGRGRRRAVGPDSSAVLASVSASSAVGARRGGREQAGPRGRPRGGIEQVWGGAAVGAAPEAAAEPGRRGSTVADREHGGRSRAVSGCSTSTSKGSPEGPGRTRRSPAQSTTMRSPAPWAWATASAASPWSSRRCRGAGPAGREIVPAMSSTSIARQRAAGVRERRGVRGRAIRQGVVERRAVPGVSDARTRPSRARRAGRVDEATGRLGRPAGGGDGGAQQRAGRDDVRAGRR